MAADKVTGDLVEFYGTECHFCIQMAPIIERLEQEEKIKVQKIEVWHNQDNAEMFTRDYDQGKCGGVPFFLNRKTNKWICGAGSYDQFKSWALGKIG